MKVLYSPIHNLHAPETEYYDGQPDSYAERPERVTSILGACKNMGLDVQALQRPLAKRDLEAMHSKHYIDYFDNRCKQISEGKQLISSVFIKDTYTPIMKHTFEVARCSAGLAVTAAELVASAKQREVYALCRPPGHHAEYDSMMGYCYFNNVALVANRLSRGGRRVAILDIDYHHGNGTQQLFYNRSDVLYVSLHADPAVAFPYGSGFSKERGAYEGLGYTQNFPLPKNTTSQLYIDTLRQAIGVVQKFTPDFFVLSLGFDTYLHDPIGNLGLIEQDYTNIGKYIAQTIQQPTVIIQEGGYNVEALGKLSANFLQGFLGI